MRRKIEGKLTKKQKMWCGKLSSLAEEIAGFVAEEIMEAKKRNPLGPKINSCSPKDFSLENLSGWSEAQIFTEILFGQILGDVEKVLSKKKTTRSEKKHKEEPSNQVRIVRWNPLAEYFNLNPEDCYCQTEEKEGEGREKG